MKSEGLIYSEKVDGLMVAQGSLERKVNGASIWADLASNNEWFEKCKHFLPKYKAIACQSVQWRNIAILIDQEDDGQGTMTFDLEFLETVRKGMELLAVHARNLGEQMRLAVNGGLD